MMHILFVDDMAVIREPISRALRSEGFEVTTAGSGQEAMAQIKAIVPDLLLLDIAMPDMDGLQFLRTLRGDASLPQPPAILLSAVDGPEAALKNQNLDVRHCLSKRHFSFEALMTCVNAVLQDVSSMTEAHGT